MIAAMITVEVFEDDGWFWQAKECLLLRGPFVGRDEADDDAQVHAEALIAALAMPARPISARS
jgi:hypothetical protein